jgi:hypothetical protein
MAQVDTAEVGQRGADRRDTGSGPRRAGIRRAIRICSRPGPWKRGLVVAALALLLGLFMLLHAKIPNRIGNLGSLVETFLPVVRPAHPGAAGRGAVHTRLARGRLPSNLAELPSPAGN